MASSPSPQSGPGFQSQTERVTDQIRIAELLNRLKENRALVSVVINGGNEPFNSAILDVDREAGHVTLDELTPKHGHRQLVEARALNAYATLHGVAMHFAGHVQEVGNEDDIAFYRVAFPELLHYNQKRSAFRVQVPLGLDVPVQLQLTETDAPLAGQLRDLSAGGIGALIPAATELEQGQIIPACNINLPGSGLITCALEVRFFKPTPDVPLARLGARFINLNGGQERAIMRSVNHLQREMLRKQTRG